jgi:eukaryotic-like serine/threonine-protein kinase
MFPVARPAALTWGGLRHWQAGRRGLAQHQWRHAINLAQRLGMPYDEARARAQLGHHTPDDEGRRQLHEAAAIFARLGCRDALADAHRP